MKWYKHDPSAALAGMIGLTIEERGAYYTLIDLQYARAPHNHVTDDLVINALGIRPKRWRRLKAGLVAKGKVHETNGNLTANRVQNQVECYLNRDSTGVGKGQNKENQGLSPRESRSQNPERASRAPKKAHARPAQGQSRFPEGWQPPDLPPDQQADFDRFADHARTHARTCADWEAAWRNWHRKSARMQQQERPNGRSLLATLNGAIDRDAAARYVPGSEGPQPITLDRIPRAAGIRSLPKG